MSKALDRSDTDDRREDRSSDAEDRVERSTLFVELNLAVELSSNLLSSSACGFALLLCASINRFFGTIASQMTPPS